MTTATFKEGDKVYFKQQKGKREGVVSFVTTHWNEKPGQYLYLVDLPNGGQRTASKAALALVK